MTITLSEAQAKLPDLIHRLATGQEVQITEGGKVVARLVGDHRPAGTRPGPGLWKDLITIVAEDDEHLRDFAEYMP